MKLAYSKEEDRRKFSRRRKIAICLLSGGIDSTVAAFYAKSLGYEVYTLSVNYGQLSSEKELQRAKKIADALGAKEKRIVNMVDFGKLSASPLTGYGNIPDYIEINENNRVPSVYHPGRDLFLLWLATAWAESIWLKDQSIQQINVFIGSNKFDSKTYPDCTPTTYKQINNLLKTSTKISTQFDKQIRVETPLISMNKAEIAKLGLDLGVPFHLTWSCYVSGEKPCGVCSACRRRAKAFSELGIAEASQESRTRSLC